MKTTPMCALRPVPWLSVLLLPVLLSGCKFDLNACDGPEDCELTQECSDGVCEEKPRVTVEGVVSGDTTWTADKVWVLKDVVTVQTAAHLTIEPGTVIQGEFGTALVVRAGGVLDATGLPEAPIVFTSAERKGERLPGDWGGLVLLGNAPVNRPHATLRIHPGELEPPFGGDDPEWYCGTLKYVRVEFAGGEVSGEEYLNNLSLGGCGSTTVIDYVQLHYGGDDGLEIFGGTVNVSHVAITRAGDEGLDIDLGWQGRGQFIAVQLDPGSSASVEIDNLKEDATAVPLTDFHIYNYTFIGSPDVDSQRGITFKAGGGGFFSHGIMMTHGKEAVDVWGVEAGWRALAGDCVLQNTLFYDIGEGGTHYFPVAGEADEDDGSGDDDAGFAEDQFYTDPARHNLFGVDPEIADAHDLLHPGWVPASDAVVGVDAPPAPFDPTANYLGAFAPNTLPWTMGWTAYPEN